VFGDTQRVREFLRDIIRAEKETGPGNINLLGAVLIVLVIAWIFLEPWLHRAGSLLVWLAGLLFGRDTAAPEFGGIKASLWLVPVLVVYFLSSAWIAGRFGRRRR
jgi:hypothetical protein